MLYFKTLETELVTYAQGQTLRRDTWDQCHFFLIFNVINYVYKICIYYHLPHMVMKFS